jgi:hypothetical protein
MPLCDGYGANYATAAGLQGDLDPTGSLLKIHRNRDTYANMLTDRLPLESRGQEIRYAAAGCAQTEKLGLR